ncbi:hypothetical protein SAMN05216241_10310 [Limimonas halophila]|uniref:Uncharacterized protein n=1 Tax=Limimonas halophila TaxID=1082479 RepID=A0A1G7PPG5_9PROT|nr:hypothetical protein [Limimonas halophila]SDF88094.1 hypothetical protein SAMN05216241_10310 [Limimonas halophila]
MFKWLRKLGGDDADGDAEAAADAVHAVEPGPGFFVPGHADRAAAAEAVDAIAERLGRVLKGAVSEQRYAGLVYDHDGTRYRSDVGEIDPRTGETVVCILHQDEREQYLICTPKRGADAGLPLLVSDTEVEKAVVFRDS